MRVHLAKNTFTTVASALFFRDRASASPSAPNFTHPRRKVFRVRRSPDTPAASWKRPTGSEKPRRNPVMFTAVQSSNS